MNRICVFILSALIVFLSADGAWAKPLKKNGSPPAPRLAPAAATSPAEELAQWEIKVSPLALLVKWITLEAGYRLNSQWVIGPSFTKYAGSTRPMLIGFRGESLGVFLTHYFQPLPENGWYASLRASHEKYTSYPGDESSDRINGITKKIEGYFFTVTGGGRFAFGGNFFLLYGLGLQGQLFDLQKNTRGAISTEKSKARVIPFAEVKVGMEF
jgi:hypothetical protein